MLLARYLKSAMPAIRIKLLEIRKMLRNLDVNKNTSARRYFNHRRLFALLETCYCRACTKKSSQANLAN